jgi:tubulin--tyrosine ligase-like protein 12
MCVDIDTNLDGENEVNDVDDEVSREKVGVVEIVENEVLEAKEKSDGTLKWLELDDLDIDDDMFLSLDLPARFPVCYSFYFVLHFIDI